MRNEDLLAGSQDLQGKLFRNSPAAIGLVRLADGVVLDVNEAYERTFGWRRAEVIGRTTTALRIWVHAQERSIFLERIASEGRLSGFRSRARRKSGEEFDSLLSSEVIEERGERLLLVMVLDVSEVRRAEEALRQSEQRFRQLNEELEVKVAARTADLDAANRELEAFSYSVSHDLRAPLRHVEGFARLLEERHGKALDAEALGYLRRVRVAVRQMNQLILDLLEFSRVGRAPLGDRDVDLSALARLIAAEIGGSDEGRVVEWRIAEGLAVHADPGLMRVVLQNLLGNAWKYTRGARAPLIEFGQTAAGEFMVRDNGRGFDTALGGSLFQPFRRLHSAEEFEGSGVGLATVRRIVERYGGHARAQGALNAGAAFYFTLGAGALSSRR